MTKPTINRSKVELVKTIALTALVAAVIAFVGGVHYQQHEQQSMDKAVSNATTQLKSTQTAKK